MKPPGSIEGEQLVTRSARGRFSLGRGRLRAPSQATLVIALAIASFVAPALYDVLADPNRAYGYLAPDAFYYFTIAVNWVEHGSATFDQVHPTNGFHPLWQWLLTLCYAACRALGLSRFALVRLSVVVGLLMLCGVLFLVGGTLARRRRLPTLAVLLPLGIWPLLISPFWWMARERLPGHRRTPLFGTLWNYANGMESALLLLLFALSGWLYVKRPAKTHAQAVTLGAVLGGLSLARLDHAIYALVVSVVPLLVHLLKRRLAQARLALSTALSWLGVLCAYLAHNVLTVGRALPVSGATKSTFPAITTGSLEWILSLHELSLRNLTYALGRVGDLAFPALLALAYLPLVLRSRREPGSHGVEWRPGCGRLSQWLALTAVGTLLLAAYDLLFVVQWHIGEWYAPVSVLFVSLVGLQLTQRIGARITWRNHRLLLWPVTLMLVATQVLFFWNLHRVPEWGQRFASFCRTQSAKVIAHYGDEPPRVLSRDDGVVAFATGFPTTSGMGLALDAEAAEAAQAGTLEKLLTRRGVDRLTSMYYLQAWGFRVGEKSSRVQQYAERALGQKPARHFEVEYVDRGFAVLRARREPAGEL